MLRRKEVTANATMEYDWIERKRKSLPADDRDMPELLQIEHKYPEVAHSDHLARVLCALEDPATVRSPAVLYTGMIACVQCTWRVLSVRWKTQLPLLSQYTFTEVRSVHAYKFVDVYLLASVYQVSRCHVVWEYQ